MATTNETKNSNMSVETETRDESIDKTGYRQCNICFDDHAPDRIVNTTCGHTFCSDCFFNWMTQEYTCPCCRTLLIRREETQLKKLSDNREEISVQNDEIEHLNSVVSDLRRLEKIYKRREKKLKKTCSDLMGRQIRVREMLSHTRLVMSDVVEEIQKIIPENGLENFTREFYNSIILKNHEKAMSLARELVLRASKKEWKRKMENILCEMSSKHGTARGNSYKKRMISEILVESEPEDSDVDEDVENAITEAYSENRIANRRRVRVRRRVGGSINRNRAQSPIGSNLLTPQQINSTPPAFRFRFTPPTEQGIIPLPFDFTDGSQFAINDMSGNIFVFGANNTEHSSPQTEIAAPRTPTTSPLSPTPNEHELLEEAAPEAEPAEEEPSEEEVETETGEEVESEETEEEVESEEEVETETDDEEEKVPEYDYTVTM